MHFLQDQKYHKDVLFCIMYSGTIGLYARCSTSNVHLLTFKKNCIIYFFLFFIFFMCFLFF